MHPHRRQDFANASIATKKLASKPLSKREASQTHRQSEPDCLQKYDRQEILPVSRCVGSVANGGVSFVVQQTILNLSHPKEVPHIRVGPLKDGIDTHEGWPARTAKAAHILTSSIGVTPEFSTCLLRVGTLIE